MSCTLCGFSEAPLEAAMLYVTAMLLQVGIIASVVLGIVCMFRRILVGSSLYCAYPTHPVTGGRGPSRTRPQR